MTEPPSKLRQQAETAFAEAQSQFLAKERRGPDVDPVAQARDEKTIRLRKVRLAKELEDKANIADARNAPLAKKA